MTYVIGSPCIDVKDRACVEECPVDCIYEGQRSLYIHPDECVDCGACEPVCPVEAIYYEDDLPAELQPYLQDNTDFFEETMTGQSEPLGSRAAPPSSGAALRHALGRVPSARPLLTGRAVRGVASLPKRHLNRLPRTDQPQPKSARATFG